MGFRRLCAIGASLAWVSAPPSVTAQVADGSFPREPLRMVYTFASQTEVVLLDLNSVSRDGDVRQSWSLVTLAAPTAAFAEAPQPAKRMWVKSRIDCRAETGAFVHAVGFEDGAVIFDVPVRTQPTPLEEAWPVDAEFLCAEASGFNVAAATFAEADAAAARIMGGGAVAEPAPDADQETSND